MKIDKTTQRDQYDSLRYPYLEKIWNVVRQDPSSADKPLDEIIASQISCTEVIAKAKSLKKE